MLSSSGTQEEVGSAGRKVSGDRTSSLCQWGKTQTTVVPGVSRPSQKELSARLVQTLVETLTLGPRLTQGVRMGSRGPWQAQGFSGSMTLGP